MAVKSAAYTEVRHAMRKRSKPDNQVVESRRDGTFRFDTPPALTIMGEP